MAYNLELLNVLLVEDDQAMRALVCDILLAFHIQNVATATDGSRAYAELLHFPADFVITDWSMEPLDGIEFTKMVRTAPDSPNPFVPVIMLTAHTQRQRIMEARDCGVTEFLAKPVTVNSLYTRIVGIIEDPRPFVRTPSYFGPDRRRVSREFMGADRRANSD
ncbi:MAG: response regulator [Alphaproteobacteria bacterium]